LCFPVFANVLKSMSNFSSSNSWPDANDLPGYSRYYGKFSPQRLVFNANLQEFAHRVNQIANAQAQGQMTTADALHQIEHLWQELQRSRTRLGLDPLD
jgi:hypothetical protein